MRSRFAPVACALAAVVASGAADAASLTISFLANEGLLLRAGDEAVVIDSFLAEPYSGYGCLPAQSVQALVRGEAPFENVRFALVSHVHRDHVQPDVAAAWLAARPGRTLAAAPQVLEAVRAADERVAAMLREEWPPPGKTTMLELGNGLRVTSFRLSHGTGRHAAIQNLGHVVHIHGIDVLHVGDADTDPVHFEPFAELLARVEIALLPYWYWEDEQGEALIARYFAGVPRIAVHVPPQEADAVRSRLAAADPAAVLFGATHEARRYEAGRLLALEP